MLNKPALICLLLAACMNADLATAREISRAEAELAVRTGARYTVSDVDNHDLRIVRMKSPQNNGSAGYACGTIDAVGSPRVRNGVKSFHASLVMHDGVLSAIVAGFYMPIEELLEQEICQ